MFRQNAEGQLIGLGADGRTLGYAQCYHRGWSEERPYSVANEFICGKIGSFLGLPIPPFALTRDSEGKVYFSSLDFNFERQKLPRVLPDLCVAKLPLPCTGILLFDILTANPDRYGDNLVADSISDPKQLQVFDQCQSLFGGDLPCQGMPRLQMLQGKLGVIPEAEVGGNRHMFLNEVSDPSLFTHWYKRIEGIHDWHIEDVCAQARLERLISRQESTAAKRFLIDRKRNLPSLVKSYRHEFKNIPADKWPKVLVE